MLMLIIIIIITVLWLVFTLQRERAIH